MSIQPESSMERAFAVSVLICSFVMSAAFVSRITASMTRLQIISGSNHHQLAVLRQYLRNNNLSMKLTARVMRSAQHALDLQACGRGDARNSEVQPAPSELRCPSSSSLMVGRVLVPLGRKAGAALSALWPLKRRSVRNPGRRPGAAWARRNPGAARTPAWAPLGRNPGAAQAPLGRRPGAAQAPPGFRRAGAAWASGRRPGAAWATLARRAGAAWARPCPGATRAPLGGRSCATPGAAWAPPPERRPTPPGRRLGPGAWAPPERRLGAARAPLGHRLGAARAPPGRRPAPPGRRLGDARAPPWGAQARNTPEQDVELLALISEPLRFEIHVEIFEPILAAHPFLRRSALGASGGSTPGD